MGRWGAEGLGGECSSILPRLALPASPPGWKCRWVWHCDFAVREPERQPPSPHACRMSSYAVRLQVTWGYSLRGVSAALPMSKMLPGMRDSEPPVSPPAAQEPRGKGRVPGDGMRVPARSCRSTCWSTGRRAAASVQPWYPTAVP